jgi:hypothetical protein
MLTFDVERGSVYQILMGLSLKAYIRVNAVGSSAARSFYNDTISFREAA